MRTAAGMNWAGTQRHVRISQLFAWFLYLYSLLCMQVCISHIFITKCESHLPLFLCHCWLKWVIVHLAGGIKNSNMLCFLFFFLLSRQGLITSLDLRLWNFKNLRRKKNKELRRRTDKHKLCLNCSIRRVYCHLPVKVSYEIPMKAAWVYLADQQWQLISVIMIWINIKHTHHTE